jgi:hypothetical protein
MKNNSENLRSLERIAYRNQKVPPAVMLACLVVAAIMITLAGLPFATPARADTVCFRAFHNTVDRVCYSDTDEDDEGILNTAEEAQIARIIAKARANAELRKMGEEILADARRKEEAKLEAARRTQCAVPFLWIKMPRTNAGVRAVLGCAEVSQ